MNCRLTIYYPQSVSVCTNVVRSCCTSFSWTERFVRGSFFPQLLTISVRNFTPIKVININTHQEIDFSSIKFVTEFLKADICETLMEGFDNIWSVQLLMLFYPVRSFSSKARGTIILNFENNEANFMIELKMNFVLVASLNNLQYDF